jgi:site-specific recombinase XerD
LDSFWSDVLGLLAPSLGIAAGEAETLLWSRIESSRAAGTVRQYAARVAEYSRWIRDQQTGEAVQPNARVAAYLAFLASSGMSRSVLSSAQAALSWFMGLRGGSAGIAQSPLASAVLSASRRDAPPVAHRAKMSRDELLAIAVYCFRDVASVADNRIGCLLILGFALFMRVSEVSTILRVNVSITGASVTVLVPRSKSDQVGKGAPCVAARSGTVLCPVSNLECWLSRAPASAHLFPSLSDPSICMSPDLVRQELNRVVSAAGITRPLTPHSIRGGAASAALADGVPQSSVKRAGRWKSDSAFDAYVDTSLASMQGAGNLL